MIGSMLRHGYSFDEPVVSTNRARATIITV